MDPGLYNSQEERDRISALFDSRYMVESVLGVGGMGAVYLVRAENGERYAMKVIRTELNLDQLNRGRFEAELAALRKLSHPNIVGIVESGMLRDGSLFFVMEHLPGGTLGEILGQKGKFTPEEILPILHAVSRALSHAHAQGIVHRDLKPDNILFAADGTAKLTDFGLAKDSDLGMSLTKTGETVGSPYYMSPEQFRGEPSTSAIDIYALGIITYELLSGTKPFYHLNYVAVATMHLNYPMPKLEDVPTWCQEFVDLCCEKKPKHRFKSADAVTTAVEHFMGVAPTSNKHSAGGIVTWMKSLFY